MDGGIQKCGYLLELSLDWIVERASENVHHLLGESHVTLIDEPLGNFMQAQALHDLRNLFSRLSGTTGIARAYRVRLTDDPELFDIAFQQIEEQVLLEAVPSSDEGFGEAFGSVGGLIASLGEMSGKALLDGAARRMRALTAYDRVTLLAGRSKATSSRTGVPFTPGANATLSDDLPLLVPDARGSAIPVFPREDEDTTIATALLRAPSAGQLAELNERGFASTMRVPAMIGDKKVGEFRLAHTKPLRPNFEIHAAAELFAQMFAMRLEVDRLNGAD
jgi:light-regulated signal transduction histidine kinase (bacteriophytochrome)